MKINIHCTLATRLKDARKQKGWSLDKASQHTGVSKAMLGQIERGESSPTVVKLWSIANGFNLPLSYFIEELEFSSAPSVLINLEQDIQITALSPFDSITGFEVFQITLFPQRKHISEPHNTGVVEHILAIDGAMEYYLNQCWHRVEKGTAVRFNADQEHGYRNMSDKPVTIHNIISYT
ncbi:helix-turn-helix domain-containing protein [Shewanella nanhaiensis]|uniref:XRE family transcriptional regulator n=1 Tax=Shewanella nanhaiensis TaxID=2864872 RepID=A0ABS7E6X7_9GAMM|nr:XRE family transcriptional regulator [Shewanella nanhaiensis]MBW8184906.1 XRE family transcriptional regulator [Shewanella nanhaiensis]